MKDLQTTCIFFRSLFDAAERLYKTNPETALEIYRSYFRYAFCETEDIETDDEIAELLVRQNVESLNAADRRYAAAVKNGEKGKDFGILGKEYGQLGGRPRKGETREEYWERKRRELEEETPQKTPLTIATAITTSITEDISNSTTITEDYSETYTLEKDAEYYLREFLHNPTKDYSSLLNNETEFINRNRSDLNDLRDNLKNKCNCNIPKKDLINTLRFLYKEERGYSV